MMKVMEGFALLNSWEAHWNTESNDMASWEEESPTTSEEVRWLAMWSTGM
jgi:hypothetical protein